MDNSTYYIIIGLSDSGISYISNTLPIIWSSDFHKAIKYDTFDKANLAVYENMDTLRKVIEQTSMKHIYIYNAYGQHAEISHNKLMEVL
jgi:lysyl-tRNA synthetase class I